MRWDDLRHHPNNTPSLSQISTTAVEPFLYTMLAQSKSGEQVGSGYGGSESVIMELTQGPDVKP